MSSQEKTPYWANAFGFAFGFLCFCALLLFAVRSCNELDIEKEKTEQLKIQNKIK
jgi:hypothetical protein